MGCESYVRAVAQQFMCLGLPAFITLTPFDIDLGRVYERFDASELDGDALGALWCHSGRSFGP